MDVIASYRAKGYIDNFNKFGLRPTLITHYWDNNYYEKPVLEKFKNYEILRIPLKESYIGWMVKSVSKIPILSKFNTFFLNLFGFFELHTIDSYFSMKSFLGEYLVNNHYDFILSIFSPHYQVRLPYILYKKFKIPYAVDFRDLWDNSVIHKDYSPSTKDKIRNKLVKFYWRKWLHPASFISITSLIWLKYLEFIVKKKGIVITNGFDKLFEPTLNKKKNLEIAHIGSLYNHQKIELFLQGVREVIDEYHINISVIFVGSIREGSDSVTSYLRNPKSLISSYLSEREVYFYNRVDKTTALNLIQQTDILLFPSFPEHPGTYSGKFFDYLASGKNILMFPNDYGVCEELIIRCEVGYIANTSSEIKNYLLEKFKEKTKYSSLHYSGKKEVIKYYSRSYQAGLMAKKILSVI